MPSILKQVDFFVHTNILGLQLLHIISMVAVRGDGLAHFLQSSKLTFGSCVLLRGPVRMSQEPCSGPAGIKNIGKLKVLQNGFPYPWRTGQGTSD